VLTRFFALLLLLLFIEAAVFVRAHDDLIALRDDPATLAQDPARLRRIAQRALDRRRVTRHHLDTLAAAAQRAALHDIEIEALNRLHHGHPNDRILTLRLADAYRRARDFERAAELYEGLLQEAR
jgi:hypothetical protein